MGELKASFNDQIIVHSTLLNIYPSTYVDGPYLIDSFNASDKESIAIAIAGQSLGQVLTALAGDAAGRQITGKKIDVVNAELRLRREKYPNKQDFALLGEHANEFSNKEIFNKALEKGEEYTLELPATMIPIQLWDEGRESNTVRELQPEQVLDGVKWIQEHYQSISNIKEERDQTILPPSSSSQLASSKDHLSNDLVAQ